MSGIIDVAVVGAGPAALAAALAAGDLGCEVTLIDARIGSGGQMYHAGMLFPGSGRVRRAAEHLPPGLARIRQVRQVRHLAATTVWRAALELPRTLGLRARAAVRGVRRPGLLRRFRR